MQKIKETAGKTILVVHTGFIHKRFIFPKLKKMGLKVIVLHFEKVNSISANVDHWILADLNNHKECILAIKSFLKNNPGIKIDGVLTYWEESTLLTSNIADEFGLIGIPYEVTLKARNKYNFRKFCKENGIAAPNYKIVYDEKELETVKKELNFPVVAKPIFGSSSAFVVKVDRKEDLKDVFLYIKNNVSSHPDSAEWDDLNIMVEEYIDGDEVDVDILLQNGKIKFWSISDNYQSKEPFFVETGQAIPSTLPQKNQEELIELASEVLEKLGIFNGVIHFEAKSTENGAVPIEANLRMGGDEVYSFVKGAWGVDLVENAVKIALGIYIKIDKPVQPKKYIVGEYFLADYSGILSQMDIDEKVKKNKNLEMISFDKKIGDAVLVPPEGYEYIGWFTVSGVNTKDAEDNLSEIKKMIKLNVVRYDGDSFVGKTERKSRFSMALYNKKLLINAAKIENINRITLKDQRKLKVGIAYNSNQNVDEGEILYGKKVSESLEKRGYKVTLFDFNDYGKVFNQIQKSNIDIILNLCEKINGKNNLSPNAAALFESLQIPYSGSNPFTLSLSLDKVRVKKLLAFHNLPTPEWDYVYSLDDEIRDDLEYPLIVKPSNANNSFGINNDSIVKNKKELMKQIKRIVCDLGRPALIEEYIEGTEFDVAVLGTEENDLQVMPLSQSIFDEMPKEYWHIYGEDEKINNYIKVNQPPKRISRKLESLITEISLDTYMMLGCKDYGRIELRVDKDDNPYILELDPDLPMESLIDLDSSPTEKEKKFGDALEKIINLTIKRYKNKYEK